MPQDMTLGQVIRERRHASKLSQQAIADRLGVTQPSVARWEADESRPSASQIEPLAELLGIPLSQMWDLLTVPSEPSQSLRDRLDAVADRLEEVTEYLAQFEESFRQLTDSGRERQEKLERIVIEMWRRLHPHDPYA